MKKIIILFISMVSIGLSNSIMAKIPYFQVQLGNKKFTDTHR